MQLVTEEELCQLLQKDYVIFEHLKKIYLLFTFNLFSIRNCVTPLIWLPQDGRAAVLGAAMSNGKLFGKERLHSRPLAAGRGAGCSVGGAGLGQVCGGGA